MQERRVTIDRDTYPLSPNFTVFATQNPIEYEGTYPLPEAQKDRFMFKIPMGCPGREEERELAGRMLRGHSPEATLDRGAVQAVFPADQLPAMRKNLEGITLREELVDYIVDIVRQTREHHGVLSGAGPRATQALVSACRAHAALRDRDFVTPDDIQQLAEPVLGHRLLLRPEFEIEGLSVNDVVQELLREVAVPR